MKDKMTQIFTLEEVRDLNKDLVIRGANPGDASHFVDLVNKQYLRKKDEKFFHWMFIRNHVPTKLITICERDKPIAFYGVLVLKLNNGLNCSLSVEIIIESEHRGRRLFLLLEDEAFKFANEHEAVAMTVFPNYNGMKAHDKIKEWKTISKIDTLIFNCRDNLILRESSKLQDNQSELTFFKKDNNYRKWRFDESPVYKYDRIELEDNIFSITKIFEDPENKTRYGDIVDFECELNNINQLKELFTRSCDYLSGQKVDFITSWALPHTLLYRILISMGFVSTAQERYFCIRVLDPHYDYLSDIKNWHFVESDSEVY